MLAKLFNIFISITHFSKGSRKETKNDVNAERRKIWRKCFAQRFLLDEEETIIKNITF
jgi:hypothetical protein